MKYLLYGFVMSLVGFVAFAAGATFEAESCANSQSRAIVYAYDRGYYAGWESGRNFGSPDGFVDLEALTAPVEQPK